MTVAKPALDASEKAARDLLNRRVRQGVFSRREANLLLKNGLPFVRTMLAQCRREGSSPEWITNWFQNKLTEAEAKLAAATKPTAQRMALTSVAAAEMYLAVWAGLQADYASSVNGQRSAVEPAPVKRPKMADVIDAPHTVYVDGEEKHGDIPADRIREFVRNSNYRQLDMEQLADGSIRVQTRLYVPQRPAIGS